jgi:hypothetical protein
MAKSVDKNGEEAEKLELDGEVKQAYSEHKFRWKTMVNSADGKRSTVFGLNRPAEIAFKNTKNIDTTKELVTMKCSAIIFASEEEDLMKGDKDDSEVKIISIPCVLSSFIELLPKNIDVKKPTV